MRQVKQHTAHIGGRGHDCLKQMPLSATDICYALETRKVVGSQDASRLTIRLPCHGIVKQTAVLWMASEVPPEAFRKAFLGCRSAGSQRMLKVFPNAPQGRNTVHPRPGTHGLRMVRAQ